MKANNILLGLTVLCLLILIMSACSSVTVRPDGGAKDSSEPSYIDSKAFYLLGLIGEHDVDVNEVCEGAAITQMQTVATGTDWIISVLTLGIYTPRTAKVWCAEEIL